MKSKTLSREKAVFIKNISKCWFVPLITLWVVLFMLTIGVYGKKDNMAACGNEIRDLMNIFSYIFIISGSLMAFFSFNYLHKEEEVSFYHSLPVTRTGIFLSITLSNVVMMLLPTAVTAIVEIAVLGSDFSEEAVMLIIYMALMQFMSYTVASFCMIISGNKICSILYMAVAFFGGYSCCMSLVSVTEQYLWYCYDPIENIPCWLTYVFCPNRLIPYSLPFEGKSTDMAESGMEPWAVFISLAVISVVFIVLCLLAYKAFRTERAGKAVSVGKADFIIKAYCAAVISVFLTFIVLNIIDAFRYSRTGRILFIVVFLILALLVYCFFLVLEERGFTTIRQNAVKIAVMIGVLTVLAIVFERTAKHQCFGIPYDFVTAEAGMAFGTPWEAPERGDMSEEEYSALYEEVFEEHYWASVMSEKNEIEMILDLYEEYYDALDYIDFGKNESNYYYVDEENYWYSVLYLKSGKESEKGLILPVYLPNENSLCDDFKRVINENKADIESFRKLLYSVIDTN